MTAQKKMTVDEMTLLTEMIADAAKKQSKFGNVDVGVRKEGTKIILPKDMSNEEAITCLKRKIKEEQTTVRIHEEVPVYPLDGAYALMEVLKEKFGWAQATPEKRQSFFGTVEIPPALVTLEIGYERYTQIIWGNFLVPGVEGQLQTGSTYKNGQPIFVIAGQVKQKFQPLIKEIADAVRVRVKNHSVYKGKAIRLRTTDSGSFDPSNAPTFLDLSRVNPEELVFPEAINEQVQTNLFTPIEKTDHCRKYGIPLKRGVLLEGRYGTGKTLTAYVTAKKCEENGWTFIYLDRVNGLKDAMTFARQYGPAVIFAEDIDRIVAGERSVKIDDILNNIDGVDSKGQELITILTTNYVERIEKAMLRPGRLDAVISVTAPDAKAAEKLVRLYGRGLVPDAEDLTEVGKELDGQIPAVIREVVERSKLHAISHLKAGQKLALSGQNLAAAARGMKRHLELMETPKAPEMSTNERLGAALGDVFLDRFNGSMERIKYMTQVNAALVKNLDLEEYDAPENPPN